MKCKYCGSETFVAHQVCRMDVLVDSDGEFKDNMPCGIESAIYDASDPYGPFVCNECGATYDELDDSAKATEGPCDIWLKEQKNVNFRKITNAEFKALVEGDVIYIQCGEHKFYSEVIGEPFYNNDSDEPGWEVETTNGFSDEDSLYLIAS